MNLVSAACPSCGAQIQIPSDQDRAFCSYCGSQIMVEAAIAYGKVKIDGVVKTQSADFIIEAGVLKEYHGASTEVVIPDNVVAIRGTDEHGVFEGMPITSIAFPPRLESISFAFNGCTKLEHITLPKNLVSINDSFDYCHSLTSVTLPTKLEYLRSSFTGCEALGQVALPAGIKHLQNVFNLCNSLKHVSLPEGLEDMRLSFNKTGFESITISTSVQAIGGSTSVQAIGGEDFGGACFRECESLKELVIEEGVTLIGEYCFEGCNLLEKVTIPASVQKICNKAFSGCKKLSEVTILGSNCTIEDGAFLSCTSLTTVHAVSDVLDGIVSIHGSSYDDTVYGYPFEYTPWYDEERKRLRRSSRLCEYCGGRFEGAIFKKCRACGKPKSY